MIRYFHYLTLITCCLCVSCTHVEIDREITELDTIKSSGQVSKIVLLMDFNLNHSDDQEVEDCIGKSLHKQNAKLTIYSAEQFRNELFPFFLASTTPWNQENYQKFFNRPVVKKKLLSLRIDYLIVVSIASDSDWGGGGFCGYSGCIGYLLWKRHSEIVATLWNLKTISSGIVRADARGTGQLPVFPVPIPIYIPATQSAACVELGRNIGEFIK